MKTITQILSATGHPLPESVNYHINRSCNFRCEHCFATFQDHPTGTPDKLSREEMFKLVTLIAGVACPPGQQQRKLTFAGGEPTLVPWLPDLVAHAAAHGLVTQVVTNGSRLDEAYLGRLANSGLVFLTLSIDSTDLATNQRIGRSQAGKPIAAEQYLQIARSAHAAGIRIKANTVVNAFNYAADMSEFIAELLPEQWKLLQVTRVDGQNDSSFERVKVSLDQFNEFIARHGRLSIFGVRLVPEEAERDVRGTYAMIDPRGCFFDGSSGSHHYSRPILKVGMAEAWSEVRFNRAGFERRGGAEWANTLHLGSISVQ